MEDEADRLLRETREYLAQAKAREVERVAEMVTIRESGRRLAAIQHVLASVLAVLVVVAAAAWVWQRLAGS